MLLPVDERARHIADQLTRERGLMEKVAEALTERGWPRPVIGGWPVPWVSPPNALKQMDAGRRDEVIASLLCQVCGCGHDPADPAYVLVKVTQRERELGARVGAPVAAMDDGLLHERCLRLAAGRCPRLRALREAGDLGVVRVSSADVEPKHAADLGVVLLASAGEALDADEFLGALR